MPTAITTATTSIFGLVTSLTTALMANELAMIFVGASLIGVAIGIFRGMKG